MIHSLVGYANCVLVARDTFATLLGITGVQYEILMVVYRLHEAEACGISEVATQVRRTVAFITIEINKLIAKGFVSKEPSFRDGRRVLLRVTPLATRKLDEIAAVQRQLNDALFSRLSASDFRALCRIYDRLAPSGVEAAELARGIIRTEAEAPLKRTAKSR